MNKMYEEMYIKPRFPDVYYFHIIYIICFINVPFFYEFIKCRTIIETSFEGFLNGFSHGHSHFVKTYFGLTIAVN